MQCISCFNSTQEYLYPKLVGLGWKWILYLGVKVEVNKKIKKKAIKKEINKNRWGKKKSHINTFTRIYSRIEWKRMKTNGKIDNNSSNKKRKKKKRKTMIHESKIASSTNKSVKQIPS